MITLGIDPGPEKSAMVHLTDGRVTVARPDIDNDELIDILGNIKDDVILGVEGLQSFGMAVGQSTFQTAYTVGRILQRCRDRNLPIRIVHRGDIKLHLCHSSRAKDANVRQALLDAFPATGGGSTPQVGTKKQPGPLYGIASHSWSALAVAVFTKDMTEASA